MRVSIVNLKGGSGKSTTAALLAVYAARRGRVLVFDADPQATITTLLVGDGSSIDPNRTGVAAINMATTRGLQAVDPSEFIIETRVPGVYIVPESLRVYESYFRADIPMISYRIVDRLVERLGEGYDVVIVDAAPDPVYSRIAIEAGEAIIVPTDTTEISVRNTRLFIEMFGKVCEETRWGKRLAGIVATKVMFYRGVPAKSAIRRVEPVLDAYAEVDPSCRRLGDPLLAVIPYSVRLAKIVARRVEEAPELLSAKWRIAHEMLEGLASRIAKADL